MAITSPKSLKPRKTPVQSRSASTVEAIYEAAIQVLLAVGAKHTTTIRVAERAGVSVGTLYQYHANIQSLMASVIQRHVAAVSNAIERSCRANHNQPIDIMVRAYVDAFVDAKTADVNISRALYAVYLDLNCKEMLQNASALNAKAVQSMLATAPDCKIEDLKMAAGMIVAAPTGPLRALIETDASPMTIAELRKHLYLLCIGYVRELNAIAAPSAIQG